MRVRPSFLAAAAIGTLLGLAAASGAGMSSGATVGRVLVPLVARSAVGAASPTATSGQPTASPTPVATVASTATPLPDLSRPQPGPRNTVVPLLVQPFRDDFPLTNYFD